MMKNQERGRELNGRERELEFIDPNSMDMGHLLDELSAQSDKPVSKELHLRNEAVVQPVNQEMKRLDEMAKNNQEIDLFYQQQMDKGWSLWDKLANRSMYQQVQQLKSNLLKTSAKYRLGFYKTLLDARLEALNERCDAGLKMIKGHYRLKVSTFLMAKMEELTLEVKDRQINFLEMMKSKYAYAETLDAYPSMKQRYIESIFQEESRYLKFLDSLLLRFESIVDEQLSKN
jgi:hypothetical protein